MGNIPLVEEQGNEKSIVIQRGKYAGDNSAADEELQDVGKCEDDENRPRDKEEEVK